MKLGPTTFTLVIFATFVAVGVGLSVRRAPPAHATAAPSPVLSVSVTHGRVASVPVRVAAAGSIAAWQEASIGAEASGLRLIDVAVNVGDVVRRGQLLARFDAAIVDAEVAEASAAVAQAEASVREAEANSARAKYLDVTGAMSAQQVNQYAVAVTTARARLDAARAVEQRQRVRLAQTRVLAPDDGVITSRTATVGAVVAAGEELFRLIRDGRLEWRAAVGVDDLENLAPGQIVTITLSDAKTIRGELRMIAPVIDAATRNGLVYVDLPRDPALRAGAFVRGHIELGDRAALTLPQGAVLLRDGFSYVMRVDPASRVALTKVSLGRHAGERIEITAGLSESDTVVASGLGFLSDGDTVRVVDDVAAMHAAERAP
jgi:RND family efflux transporter MFP subunit